MELSQVDKDNSSLDGESRGPDRLSYDIVIGAWSKAIPTDNGQEDIALKKAEELVNSMIAQ